MVAKLLRYILSALVVAGVGSCNGLPATTEKQASTENANLQFNTAGFVTGTLYEQPVDPSGKLFLSSWLDPEGSDLDQYTWDNFTLPSDQSITEIGWIGAYDPARGGLGGSVLDFRVWIYPSIAVGTEPAVAGLPLVQYQTGDNAGETPIGSVNGISMNSYAFTLPTPFNASAGVKYWVHIVASQGGSSPDWSIAAGTGGNSSHYRWGAGAGGDSGYRTVPGDLAFTLLGPIPEKITPTVTWTTPADITYGTALDAMQLNATASVEGTFIYFPPEGTILDAGAGQVLSVDFYPTDTVTYNSVFGTTVTINVNKATPVVAWANPADITVGTLLSEIQLNATASVPGNFVYTPPAGTVLAVGAGQVLSVDFTPTDTLNFNSVLHTTVTINVNNKITPTITWANPADITYGTPLSGTQLNATSSVAGTFVYTPAEGTVLNAGAGQILSVDFTPTDTANYNSVPGTTVMINVNKATPIVTWANPASITYGTALSGTQLNAMASIPGSFVYTPAIGTVLNASAGQTLSVDFTPTDKANYNSVLGRTVTITVNKATPIVIWTNPADITYGTALSGAQLNATASVAGTFVYTPPVGTVLNVGAGQTISVDFTPSDTINYNNVLGRTVAINVNNKVTPVITWANPADITYGTPLDATQLNATASVPGAFVYTPPAGTVLNAGAGQTLSVDFTPTDTANYNSVLGRTVTINVNKATPIVTWANPADIIFGTPLSGIQLNATASVPGTFVYTPPVGTILNAGVGKILSVDFTPTDSTNYNNVLGTTVKINVNNKVTPVITWANPADITYGTALSETQLNATASVPGTFVYNPPAGTVLNAGAGQVLSVDFMPTDSTNYNNVVGSTVTINVNKATPTVTWTNPANITYGTVLTDAQLNATSSVTGIFVYTPPAGTVLNVGAGQTLSVDFTPTDTANYNRVLDRTVTINVNKATPIVTWATPADITYGTPLSGAQLNATTSVTGTFVYTPPAGTILDPGAEQILSVDFIPTDSTNYNSVLGSTVTINVVHISPANTPGKVTGGGNIDSSSGKATFGFVIQYDAGAANPSGNLTFVDHDRKMNLKADSFTLLYIDGNHATITGYATVNGVPNLAFVLDVTDNDESGSNDMFKIQIPGLNEYSYGGVITGGNIKVAPK
jgi:hypothetical protein